MKQLGALLVLAACGAGSSDSPSGNADPITGLGPRGEGPLDLYDESSTSATTTGVTITAGESGGDSDSGGEAPEQTSGPSLDLGAPPGYTDDQQPAGCQERKVDFLFLVGHSFHLEEEYATYLAAIPAFMEIIETKFAGFDRHILFANVDSDWGAKSCDENGGCADGNGACSKIPGYPCGAIEQTTACDWEIGAGVTFPAGTGASNHPCPLVAGRRYIVEEHPQEAAAFECIATLGTSGDIPRYGDALLAALGPTLNGPDGCNAGFLRDDAILVITSVSPIDDTSENGPKDWYDAIVAARRGDLRSVALLGVMNDNLMPDGKCADVPPKNIYYPKLLELVDMIPGGVYASICEPVWSPFFDEATDRALEFCAWATVPE